LKTTPSHFRRFQKSFTTVEQRLLLSLIYWIHRLLALFAIIDHYVCSYAVHYEGILTLIPIFVEICSFDFSKLVRKALCKQ